MKKNNPAPTGVGNGAAISMLDGSNIRPFPQNDNHPDRLDVIRDLRFRRNCSKLSELGAGGFYYFLAQVGAERGVRTYLENLAEMYASLDREEVEQLGRLHLPPSLFLVVEGGKK